MHTDVQNRSVLVALLALAAASGSARAQMATQVQPEQQQGQFANWAVGMSLFDANFSASAGDARVRAPGVQGGQPIAWSAAVFGAATQIHPDYSIGALTANWNVAPPSGVPLFGGVSTGGDVTPSVNAQGVLQAVARVWYALNVSVKSGAQGLPGSLIHARALAGGAGNDVFSYYPYHGVALPPSFENTARVELTAAQLGIGASTLELQNLDFGMGLISVDPNGQSGFFAPVRDKLYFTITKAALLAAGAWPPWDNAPVDCATVYCMTWDGAQWAAPVVAYTRGELLPAHNAETDPEPEIDALSVYQTAGHDRLVFSLTLASNPPTEPYDQILVHQRLPVPCATLPLQAQRPIDPAPVRISERFGLRQVNDGEPDDVDGTCGVDPRYVELPGESIATYMLGVPYADNASGTKLGLSQCRTRLPDPGDPARTVDTVFVNVTGLSVEHGDLGLLAFFLHDGDQAQLLVGPLLVDAAAIGLDSWTISYASPPPTSESKPIRISALFVPYFLASGSFGSPRGSWIVEMY